MAFSDQVGELWRANFQQARANLERNLEPGTPPDDRILGKARSLADAMTKRELKGDAAWERFKSEQSAPSVLNRPVVRGRRKSSQMKLQQAKIDELHTRHGISSEHRHPPTVPAVEAVVVTQPTRV